MKYQTYILFVILFGWLSHGESTATSPTLQKTAEITSIEVIGTPKKDQAIEFRVTYKALVDADAILTLSVPSQLSPEGFVLSDGKYTENILLVNGQTYVRSFQLDVVKEKPTQMY